LFISLKGIIIVAIVTEGRDNEKREKRGRKEISRIIFKIHNKEDVVKN